MPCILKAHATFFGACGMLITTPPRCKSGWQY